MPMHLMHRLLESALPLKVFGEDDLQKIYALELAGLVAVDHSHGGQTDGYVTVLSVTEIGHLMAATFRD